MSQFEYLGAKPQIGPGVFLAEGSIIIGKVTIGENSAVWFNSVLRGDVANITIGKNTNIQDGSVLHITDNIDLTIGNNVTVGHNAILHSCTINDHALVGMGSLIMDNVIILIS